MRKIICCILTFLILLSVLSCANSDVKTDITTTAASTETETSTESAEPFPDVAKTDYQGSSFTILYPGWGLYNDYFFSDEQNGDQMNDAIYERKRRVEEYLNIKIGQITPGYIGEILPAVKKSVMAGGDDYQLVLTHCIQDLGSMMTAGYLTDWNTIPYVDMSRSYWNSSMNDSLSVNGKLYYAASSFMIADPNAFLFNKEMIDQYNLDDPYQVVRDGKWTIDKLTEMTRAVTQDINGDGIYDANDLYGLGAENDWMLISFMYGCNQFMVQKNSNDEYELSIYNDKMITLINKLNDLFYNGNSVFLWKYQAPTEDTVEINTGRVLFEIITINSSKKYRQSEVDFGVLPFPKFDEAQEQYVSLDWSGLMCIPTTAQNLDMIGAANELLAYESLDTTVPAYYDVLLTGKFARDDETVEMLDIIFSNIVYDYGMNFCGFSSGFNNLFYTIPQLVGQNKSADFASWYAKYEKSAQTSLKNLARDIDKLGQ
jgi:hypothetical protein